MTLTAIGTHIFNNAFTVGLLRHGGIRINAVLETSNPARKLQSQALRITRKATPSIDVRHGSTNWNLASLALDPPDLVYANPPCALWSKLKRAADARNKKAANSDDKIACWVEALAVFNTLKPRIFIGESLFTFADSPIFNLFHGMAAAMGYEVHRVFHDPKFMGLPQQRRRLFVVASRHAFDAPTYPFMKPPVNLESAIRHLGSNPGAFTPVKEAWECLYAGAYAVSNGRFRKTMKFFDLEHITPIPSMVRRRLKWQDVCQTVTKPQYLYHPDETRSLGMREASVLMGFDENYPWDDNSHLWMCKGVTPVAGLYAAHIAETACASTRPARVGEVFDWDYTAPTVRVNDYRYGHFGPGRPKK